MNLNETIQALSVGLPEEIARLKAAGYYTQAIAQIDALLAEDWTAAQNAPEAQGLPAACCPKPENPMPSLPDALRACLLANREQMRRLPADYPFDRAMALDKLMRNVAGFSESEFDVLLRAQRLDWRFVEGRQCFARRFYESLLDTDEGYAARAGQPLATEKRRRQHEAILRMEKNGVQKAKIRLRLTLRPTEEAFQKALAAAKAAGRDKVKARFWLPLPAACPAQSEIELVRFSAQPTAAAPEDAPQRTAFWEMEWAENGSVSVEFSYVQTALYTNPLVPPEKRRSPDFLPPAQYLGEQLPHIRFTPYLRALTEQLVCGALTQAEKAKRIYDYITLNVHYRYMPAYFVLEDIAENCARSRRGDCGVQALTFITMCRIAGIPAAWQSGLSVSAERAGCHDWAMFYLEEAGWLYADCSFGGSSARAGDEERRLHYFGSLDAGRMAANRAFEALLAPPKESWRADPYDNQSGEAELEGIGLVHDEYETEMTVLEFTALDE